jgi:hypothetical protein
MKDLSFNPYPHSNGTNNTTAALEQTVLTLAWLFWTMHLLAELACAGMVLLLYLSLWFSEPLYTWLPLLTYLLQGFYLVYLKRDGQPPIPETGKPINRWRLAVAILGWPCHRVILQVYADLLRDESRQPSATTDSSWFHTTLVFAILRWGMVWYVAFSITLTCCVFIQQVGWLGG